jgi:hypothetical protein
MNKNKIVEGTLGKLIVALTEETRRTARNKQKIHLPIAESLRDLLILRPRSWKPTTDNAT